MKVTIKAAAAAKPSGAQAVYNSIARQLKRAKFKQTANRAPEPSGKGFMYSMKAWKHKSGATVVMQVGCAHGDKNKVETITMLARSKADASRHTSFLPLRKINFNMVNGEWKDKASQKEYLTLLKQMPKVIEKYLTQFE